MIVYASSIWLDNSTKLLDVFSQITIWLHEKTKERIFPEKFTDQPKRKFGDDSVLEIIKTDENYPLLYTLKYSQRDPDVSGRQWVTEIGIQKEGPGSEIQCSFLVYTNEISVNVPPPQLTTRPRLIYRLLTNCIPSEKTIGTTIKTIETEEYKTLLVEIESPDRNYPIILISPTINGEYLIDLPKLFFQTIGLAQIVQIPIGSDTYKISEILGKEHSAYHGAINILFPLISRRGESYVPTKLLLPDLIAEIVGDNKSVEGEILTSICHRTNLPNSWAHISADVVKESIRQRELINLRKKYSSQAGEIEQYLALLQEENTEKLSEIQNLKSAIESLRGESDYYSSQYDIVNEERKQLQNKVEGLISQIEDKKLARQQAGKLEDCSEELRILIESYFNESITPYQSLDLISRLFPDRVVILNSAFESANNSKSFIDKKEVFILLWKLATSYWQSLNQGKGDTEARLIFGRGFSAKESETVENKKAAKKRRTFTYKDRELEMMKHLKHGVKNSKAETIRIHFEWLNDEKRIIVGYCGFHLDFD